MGCHSDQFESLAIAVNAGTNIPSIATPNGQAAFLFLLTSALAPLIRLGYVRMLWMALPYAVVLSVVAFVATVLWVYDSAVFGVRVVTPTLAVVPGRVVDSRTRVSRRRLSASGPCA